MTSPDFLGGHLCFQAEKHTFVHVKISKELSNYQ